MRTGIAKTIAVMAFGLSVGNVLIAGLYLEAAILAASFFIYGFCTVEQCFADVRKLLKEHGILREET